MCPFCEISKKNLLAENLLALAILDSFPVTTGHTLVIPKRHATDYFDLTVEEVQSCHELLCVTKQQIISNDRSVEGFNIGLNAGEVAGQTIFHCHFHLIPRRRGDVPDPRGGVRHVIPGKGTY